MIRTIKRITLYVIALLSVVLTSFPLLYLVSISVKPLGIMFDVPPKYFFLPDLSHYITLFVEKGFYTYYVNSFIISGIATLLTLAIGALAAYGFARYNFKLGLILYFLIVFTRAFMPVTTLIPLYLAAAKTGLLDTRFLLIIVYTSFELPLAVLILTTFFKNVPISLYESAELDGMCSFGIFSKIALPLSKSGLFAAGLLVFIYNWNEFIFALVTTSVKARTATVALTGFVTNDSSVFWGELSALGFFMTIPVIIFALIFNKVLMRGVFAGAIKG